MRNTSAQPSRCLCERPAALQSCANETAYMVLDLINGFDLHNIMQANNAPLPPDGVKDMLLQLLDAVETLDRLWRRPW